MYFANFYLYNLQAQNLPQVITTTSKMLATDSNLYLYATGNKAIGILKVGIKKLFIRVRISYNTGVLTHQIE